MPTKNEKLLAKYHDRCDNCGGSWNVAGHHIVARSKLRIDVASNLVALCCNCHSLAHSNPVLFYNTCKDSVKERLDDKDEIYINHRYGEEGVNNG